MLTDDRTKTEAEIHALWTYATAVRRISRDAGDLSTDALADAADYIEMIELTVAYENFAPARRELVHLANSHNISVSRLARDAIARLVAGKSACGFGPIFFE